MAFGSPPKAPKPQPVEKPPETDDKATQLAAAEAAAARKRARGYRATIIKPRDQETFGS